MAIMILRVAVGTGATLMLSGAGPKEPLRNIRSIGIIAALGDTCMFEHIPDATFEWIAAPGASFLEISDWGIDDSVTSTITIQLGARYSVQPIPVEHQDFDTWTYDSLARHIRDLPIPEAPVDAYLLVLRDWRGDMIGNTNQQVGGLGLYRRDAHHGGGRYGVFAAYRLVLLDANTGDLIAAQPALLRDHRLPWFPARASLWPRTPNDLTAAQKYELRADFLKLIDAALPRGLRQLGLER